MKRLLTLAALAVLWALPVLAMESAPVSSPRAVATLVSETDAIQPGQPFRVGLNLRMADGWHTYWKNPGDAGAPPELTIEGGTASPIDWPTPRRVAEGPVMTYAYTGQVLLPVTVTAATGDDQGACAVAGLQGHLRAGGRRLRAQPAHRHAEPVAAGGAVRRA